jgi:hypothetical protein
MARWKQFCFSDGEAIREEGGAGRIGIRPSPSDKAGVRQRETLTGRVNSGQILRPLSRPYPDTTFAKALDLDPNSLRQNDSI